MDRVSEKILEDVKKLKIPLSTLGKFVHLSKSSITLRLQGKRKWKIPELRELSRVFGHDPNYYEGFLNLQ